MQEIRKTWTDILGEMLPVQCPIDNASRAIDLHKRTDISIPVDDAHNMNWSPIDL